MATHSSILAWRIPRTEEPSGLQSVGSQRVRHNRAHIHRYLCDIIWAFQVAPVVKNPPANAGDTGDVGSIPGSGRSPRGRNGNPLQCSCLKNPMDRGAWWATVQSGTVSDMTEQLNTHTHTHTHTHAESGSFI